MGRDAPAPGTSALPVFTRERTLTRGSGRAGTGRRGVEVSLAPLAAHRGIRKRRASVRGLNKEIVMRAPPLFLSLCIAVSLACGSNPGNGNVTITQIAPGAQCPAGGVSIASGGSVQVV